MIIGCTSTPSMRASGRAWRARSKMPAAASRTEAALARFRRTPPTSDLCTMSCDRIFNATGWPSASSGSAAATAASGSVAHTADTTGMP